MKSPRSEEVSQFLNALQHPLRLEIETLRAIILDAHVGMIENIKWNGPNYVFGGDDRITMKIQPPKQIQIIFHRGAKVKDQPAQRLISDDSKLLVWRENDRAIASFKSAVEIDRVADELARCVRDWLRATSAD